MPWRTSAFHCSSFLLATAREVVSEGRFKALPPTHNFMVQVRQTLSWPVFLSRYFSRKREPDPRSLMCRVSFDHRLGVGIIVRTWPDVNPAFCPGNGPGGAH